MNSFAWLPLDEIVTAVTEEAKRVSFAPDLQRFPCIAGTPYERLVEPNGFYCKALAAFGRLADVQHGLELGSYFGTSAMAFAKGAKKVSSVDICWDHLLPELFNATIDNSGPDFLPYFHGRLRAIRIGDGWDVTRLNFHDYDCLFVDVGDHTGLEESAIHARLVSEDWRGIVLWDDCLWGGMVRFWETIKEEKILTDWHRESGFGISRYSGRGLGRNALAA